MAASDPPRPDAEELMRQVRESVGRRRAAGDYPPGMEHELDERYRRIVAGHAGGDLERLLKNVEAAAELGTHRIQTVSGAPLGSAVHGAVGKLVVRQTEGVLGQVRELAVAVMAVLDALVAERPEDATSIRDLSARVDLLLERAAAEDRERTELAARLDRLEAALADLRRAGE